MKDIKRIILGDEIPIKNHKFLLQIFNGAKKMIPKGTKKYNLALKRRMSKVEHGLQKKEMGRLLSLFIEWMNGAIFYFEEETEKNLLERGAQKREWKIIEESFNGERDFYEKTIFE